MRILITGASGFTGSHMLSYLDQKTEKHEIFALKNSKINLFSNTSLFLECDLLCVDKINSVMAHVNPEIIIHLAGKNHGTLEDLVNVNLIGTRNLLNAVINLQIFPRILVIGSSAEYGYVGSDTISELTSVNPVSEYGISKVASSFLALHYYFSKNLPVAVIRPFNLIGPGLSDKFVTGKIIRQICTMGNSLDTPISLKRIDSKRDFVDVRDVVHAFWLVLTHPQFFKDCAGNIFNVGSGQSYSIEDIFSILGSIQKKTYNIQVIQDDIPELIPSQVCNYGKINALTRWKPLIRMRTSLEDMINSEETCKRVG